MVLRGKLKRRAFIQDTAEQIMCEDSDIKCHTMYPSPVRWKRRRFFSVFIRTIFSSVLKKTKQITQLH